MVFAALAGIAVVLSATPDPNPRKTKSFSLDAQFYGAHKDAPLLAKLDYFAAAGTRPRLEDSPIFFIDASVVIWTAADKTKAGLNLDDYADYDVVGAVNYIIPMPNSTTVTIPPWVRVCEAAASDSIDTDANTFTMAAQQWTRELKERGVLRVHGVFTPDGRYGSLARKPFPRSVSVVEGPVIGATRKPDESLESVHIAVSAVYFMPSGTAKSGVDPSPVRKRKSWNYDTGSITESPTKRVKAENVIAGPSGTHADENEDEQQAAKEDEKPPGKSRKGAR